VTKLALALLICAAGTIASSGCSTDRRQVEVNAFVADCQAKGGKIVMSHETMCIVAMDDAGKTCSDSAECQGGCAAPDGSVAGTKTTGTCAAESGWICTNDVQSGVATGFRCP
jgi:hypothetical protein